MFLILESLPSTQRVYTLDIGTGSGAVSDTVPDTITILKPACKPGLIETLAGKPAPDFRNYRKRGDTNPELSGTARLYHSYTQDSLPDLRHASLALLRFQQLNPSEEHCNLRATTSGSTTENIRNPRTRSISDPAALPEVRNRKPADTRTQPPRTADRDSGSLPEIRK